MSAGYSTTPLARKLSLKDGMRVWAEAMPKAVRDEIDQAGLDLIWLDAALPEMQAAHVFVMSRAELEDAMTRLLPRLAPHGFLWISWPKKSAGLDTDLSEDIIREVALPTGLVDVKVCAIDSVWSGLKLMIRRSLRT